MTYQEILDGILRNRAHPANISGKDSKEILRKFNEIEWALQELAENLRDAEAAKPQPPTPAAKGAFQ